MARFSDRDEFIHAMTRDVPTMPLSVIHGLMRAATTLHRLAERECNGDDWQGGDAKFAFQIGTMVPCPEAPPHGFNRQGVYVGPTRNRPTSCPSCEAKPGHTLVTKSSIQETATRRRVTAAVTPYGFVPQFSGDPRGAVLRLARTTNESETGRYVPAGRR